MAEIKIGSPQRKDSTGRLEASATRVLNRSLAYLEQGRVVDRPFDTVPKPQAEQVLEAKQMLADPMRIMQKVEEWKAANPKADPTLYQLELSKRLLAAAQEGP